MKQKSKRQTPCRLVLRAETAADLMTPNPVSIRADATVKEATAFLTDKGFSAAPVIDDTGRPVGVLSRADIVVHDREKVDYLPVFGESVEAEHVPRGFQVENVDRTLVGDIMTPVVFSASPDMPASKVVEEMLDLKVHRLFVVSSDGVLVGVISSLDILHHLHPEMPAECSPALALSDR